jgi:hypothetical protein
LPPPELIAGETRAASVAKFPLRGVIGASLDHARMGCRSRAHRDDRARPQPSCDSLGHTEFPVGRIVPQRRLLTLAVAADKPVEHLAVGALKLSIARQERPTGTTRPRERQGLEPTIGWQGVPVLVEDDQARLWAARATALESIHRFLYIHGTAARELHGLPTPPTLRPREGQRHGLGALAERLRLRAAPAGVPATPYGHDARSRTSDPERADPVAPRVPWITRFFKGRSGYNIKVRSFGHHRGAAGAGNLQQGGEFQHLARTGAPFVWCLPLGTGVQRPVRASSVL